MAAKPAAPDLDDAAFPPHPPHMHGVFSVASAPRSCKSGSTERFKPDCEPEATLGAGSVQSI